MWASDAFMPGQTGFAGGCFSGPALPEPGLSAYDDDRCAWVGLPETWLRMSPPA